MKYSKEYEEYMRKITETFIGKLTHSEPINTPKYRRIGNEIKFDYTSDEDGDIAYCIDEAPQEMDIVITRPQDVIKAWLKIENQCALKWLRKHAITYEEWLEKAILK